MTNTKPASEVLKSDVLGRVKTPRDKLEALLDEFERSVAGCNGRVQKFVFKDGLMC